eukprot:scaffold53676_cov36-Cyclotella_meneghiniana.AAC.2
MSTVGLDEMKTKDNAWTFWDYCGCVLVTLTLTLLWQEHIIIRSWLLRQSVKKRTDSTGFSTSKSEILVE